MNLAIINHAAPPRPAPPSPPPCYTATILDEAKARQIDPLFPSVFPLWAAGTSPLEIGGGAVRIEPVDQGTPIVGDLSIDAYECLIKEHGAADTGDVSGEWDDDGARAVREAVHDSAMRGQQLRVWRGEVESRIRQAEAIGRWFGMSPAAIAAVTGRPYIPRASMLPTCDRARDLTAKREASELAARQEAEQAAALAREAARPRTLMELGIEAVAVRRDRVVVAPEPFAGAALLWSTDVEHVYGWRHLLGLELPAGEVDGIRVLGRDELAPPTCRPVPEPTLAAVGFAMSLRARLGAFSTGPVLEFTDAALDAGRALAAASVRYLIASPTADYWRAGYLVRVLVRRMQIRPDVAVHVLLEAADREHTRRNPPVRLPTIHAQREYALSGTDMGRPDTGVRLVDRAGPLPSQGGLREELGALAAAAAAGCAPGDVGLEVEPVAVNTKSKKAKSS